jgi:hypothetical protein
MLPLRGSNAEFEAFKKEWESKVVQWQPESEVMRDQSDGPQRNNSAPAGRRRHRAAGGFGPGFSQAGNW